MSTLSESDKAHPTAQVAMTVLTVGCRRLNGGPCDGQLVTESRHVKCTCHVDIIWPGANRLKLSHSTCTAIAAVASAAK